MKALEFCVGGRLVDVAALERPSPPDLWVGGGFEVHRRVVLRATCYGVEADTESGLYFLRNSRTLVCDDNHTSVGGTREIVEVGCP